MRIKFPSLEFTGSGNGEEADGLRLRVTRSWQVEEFFEASEIESIDNGNAQTTVTFEVTRQHASEDVAEAYILTHAKACQDQGSQTITFMRSDGTTTIKTLDKGRVISADLQWHKGVATRWSYTLGGGALNA